MKAWLWSHILTKLRELLFAKPGRMLGIVIFPQPWVVGIIAFVRQMEELRWELRPREGRC